MNDHTHQCMKPRDHYGIHECTYCGIAYEYVALAFSGEPTPCIRMVDCTPSWVKAEEKERMGFYWMEGRCANCHTEGVMMKFLKGRETTHGRCPVCEVGGTGASDWHGVHARRLATPEEIPQ